MDNWNDKLRENIRLERKRSGMTQGQVADALGIRRAAYSNYELGYATPSINTLCDLAKLFHTTPDRLVSYAADEPALPEGLTVLGPQPLSGEEQMMLLLFRLCDEDASRRALKYLQKLAQEQS